jgi:hypothetical protein
MIHSTSSTTTPNFASRSFPVNRPHASPCTSLPHTITLGGWLLSSAKPNEDAVGDPPMVCRSKHHYHPLDRALTTGPKDDISKEFNTLTFLSSYNMNSAPGCGGSRASTVGKGELRIGNQ